MVTQTPAHCPGPSHPLPPARALYSRVNDPAPKILIAILAKQKESMLPLDLRCIEALDYPKSSILVYIRTNCNTDRTRQILEQWANRMRLSSAAMEIDASDVMEKVDVFDVHEWNAVRFRVLGHIRNISLLRTLDHGCAYYFAADVDNFIRPLTLRELVALSLPIVAPFLRTVEPGMRYSNFHADIDIDGYFRDGPRYNQVPAQELIGVIELPVVHCTYLIRADVIPQLNYQDSSGRHEYVVFSESARRNGVPQYLDNRQVYGYLTFDDGKGAVERAAKLIDVHMENAR